LASDTPALAAVPFVYRYYPTVREARERVRQGETGALRLIHGTYLQDWLLRPEDDNWRVDEDTGGASRAFADIGSHWCDLAEFIGGLRITRVCARLLTAVPDRERGGARAAFAQGDGTGERRHVGTEDAAVVQFETDTGAVGAAVVSQISAGRKNRLWLELDGADESVAFDQEAPETLWVGRREHDEVIKRDPAFLSAPAARLATLPAGHPQGYADCFDAFVEDVYSAIEGSEPPDGLPIFADGLRATEITDAVLASSREGRWVDVAPAPTPAMSR
jgi:predicted dehydrogenase